jgi:hypothetical protein
MMFSSCNDKGEIKLWGSQMTCIGLKCFVFDVILSTVLFKECVNMLLYKAEQHKRKYSVQ